MPLDSFFCFFHHLSLIHQFHYFHYFEYYPADSFIHSFKSFTVFTILTIYHWVQYPHMWQYTLAAVFSLELTLVFYLD